MRGSRVRAIVVVVPVHNEAELLDRCLLALGAAVDEARGRGIRCVVRIVLDDCSDDSAEIAARHPFPVLTTDAATVGRARAIGVESALTEVRGIPARRVWIANTDADSAVPAHWLTLQSDLAGDGADLVVGTVRPDFDDLTPAHRRHWEATHTQGKPNGHTHGANLGVRASVYSAVGGFAALVEHEDVGLVEACRMLGAVVVASDAAEVLTSGRFTGRTPGGYAGYLRDQAEALGVG